MSAEENKAIDIFWIVDGKIWEHWAVADMLGLMQQLGVVSTLQNPGVKS